MGLTQDAQVKAKLDEHGFTSCCFAQSFGIGSMSAHDIVGGQDSPLQNLILMLHASEERFGNAAETWNAAVEREVGSLDESTIPDSFKMAAHIGEMIPKGRSILLEELRCRFVSCC